MLPYVLMSVVLLGLAAVAYAVAPRGVKAAVRSVGRLARSAGRSRIRVAVTATVVCALLAAVVPAWWTAGLALLCAALAAAAADRGSLRVDDPAVLVALGGSAASPAAVWIAQSGLLPDVSVEEWLPLLAAGSVVVAAVAGACVGLARRGSRGPRLSEAHVALGVTEAAAQAARVRLRRTRDGRVSISPVPPAARVRSDVQERVAQVWPGWAVESISDREIILAREGVASAQERALLAETGGLISAVQPIVDPPAWRPSAMAIAGPAPWRAGDVARLEDVVAERGLSLVEIDLDRGRAVAAAISGPMHALRQQLAAVMGWRPTEIELLAEAGDDCRPARVRVERAPVIPEADRRVEAWQRALNDAVPPARGDRWDVRDLRGGRIEAVRVADPLLAVQDYQWGAPASLTGVPFAVDETGSLVTLGLLEVNQLLGGTPGGGKSGGVTALLCGISRLEHVALVGLDPKRVELAPWAPRFSRVAKLEDDATSVLEALVEEMERRYGWLEEQGLKKITPSEISDQLPLLVLVIDELADLVSVGASKEEKEAETRRSTMIRRLIAKGRAAGLVVIAATQKPQSDVVPTALRDLIQLRVAYATTNAAMTDTILGAGMAQNGGLAHEISADQRGVCYLVSETSRTPRRARTFWVPDEEVAGIARRVAHLRVELPWMPPAPQAAAAAESASFVAEEVQMQEMQLSWDDLADL